MYSVTVDNIQLGIFCKPGSYLFEGIREIIIVCIQPCYDVTFNLILAFSDRSCLSRIRF